MIFLSPATKSCFVAAAAGTSVPDEWLSSTCPGNPRDARTRLQACSRPTQRRTSPVGGESQVKKNKYFCEYICFRLELIFTNLYCTNSETNKVNFVFILNTEIFL